jgi:hypothetical protein
VLLGAGLGDEGAGAGVLAVSTLEVVVVVVLCTGAGVELAEVEDEVLVPGLSSAAALATGNPSDSTPSSASSKLFSAGWIMASVAEQVVEQRAARARAFA